MSMLHRNVSRMLLALVATCALAADDESPPRLADGTFRMATSTGKVSIEAREASARTILAAMCAEAGVEVSFPPAWERTVSVHFQDVPFEDAVGRIAGNWALLQTPRETQDRHADRVIVLPGSEDSDGIAVAHYLDALEAFEPPTVDERRLIQKILRKGWVEEGRALQRLFDANEEAFALFEMGLRAPRDRFEWGSDGEGSVDIAKGRDLLSSYLVRGWAQIADDRASALVSMASTLKFADDLGRDGPVRAKVAEDSLRQEILAAVQRGASSTRGRPDILRAASRETSGHGPGSGQLGPALRQEWPEASFESGDASASGWIDAADLAGMPFRESAGLIAAAAAGDSATRNIDPEGLPAMRRILEARMRVERRTVEVQVELAALAFLAERRRPPERVGDLVPDYLDRVPLDSFTGGDLAEAEIGEGCRLRLPSPAAVSSAAAGRPRFAEVERYDVIVEEVWFPSAIVPPVPAGDAEPAEDAGGGGPDPGP